MPSEAGADRPLLTVAEATTVLRIGRSLGYQLAREYLASGGTTGLPVIRLGYGHLEVAHASTIHAAQSATVDETHTLAADTMGADALNVAMTRGRHTNHVHLRPPTFGPERQHSPLRQPAEPWTARQAFIDICVDDRHSDDTAIARRRELRHLNTEPAEHDRRRLANIDTNTSPTVAAAGRSTRGTVTSGQRTDDVARTSHDSPTLAELVAAHEQRTTEPILDPLDDPAIDHNAELRAGNECHRLVAERVNFLPR